MRTWWYYETTSSEFAQSTLNKEVLYRKYTRTLTLQSSCQVTQWSCLGTTTSAAGRSSISTRIGLRNRMSISDRDSGVFFFGRGNTSAAGRSSISTRIGLRNRMSISDRDSGFFFFGRGQQLQGAGPELVYTNILILIIILGGAWRG